MPEHNLHILQRPKLGTNFIRQYPVSRYSHQKSARGGDMSASCSVYCSASEAQRFFAEFIGCVVQFYVDNPIDPIFEGYISRVTVRTGGVTATRSLEAMTNKVRTVFYNANSAATAKTEQNAFITTPRSIDEFGEKHGTFDGGIHFNNADKTHQTILTHTLNALRAFPMISIASADRQDQTIVELEIRGLVDFAWGWNNYESTDTTLNTASDAFAWVTARSDGVPSPNSSLVLVTGTAGSRAVGDIISNTTFNISRESRSGSSYLDYIRGIVEAGDGSAQFAFGISRSNIFKQNRYVYYKPANSVIKYTTKVYQDAGFVRSPTGAIIPGHLVEPDAKIRLLDFFPEYDVPGNDNPRIGYIEEITYDGESGRVQWVTGDNLTLEGQFNANSLYKKAGQLFGAPNRQTL